MFELGVPIRLYWDMAPGEDANLPYGDICDGISGLKILSLDLAVPGCPISTACLDVLQRLQGHGMAITVVLAPEACTIPLLARLSELQVRRVLVAVSSLAEVEGNSRLFLHGGERLPVGISFDVTRDNWRELPPLLSFCGQNDVGALSLPMQRLWNGEPCFFLHPEEKRELSSLLGDVAMPGNLKVTIHDPFLWKLFYPSIPFPDGGCQAANTMLALSPEGDVYPCPTLPVKLGNVTSSSLREIATSSAKKQVRTDILRYPGPCAGCSDLLSCKGGCRGRALAVSASLDNADPGCPS